MNKLYAALSAATALTALFVGYAAATAKDKAGTTTVAATTKPQYGAFGFDTGGMDRAVKPGDDFYRYANGGWTVATPIPADKSNFGMFTVLADLSQTRTRAILDAARGDPSSKIGAAYASFLDEAKVEASGLGPLKPWLDRIKAVATRDDFAAVVGEAGRNGVADVPFGLYVDQDAKQPTRYTVNIVQGGLGMPDRDYYLSTDASMVQTRAAYEKHLTAMLTLAGEGNAATRAKAIVGLETEIAKAHWTQVESRDADKTYNKRTLADLQRDAAGFDFARLFAASHIPAGESVNVAQPSAVAGIAAALGKADLGVLRDLILVRSLDGFASKLPRKFVDENFAFYGTTLSGTPQIQPRWKRAVDFTTTILGEEVGKVYVARYFPPETKAKADALVRNLIAAMDRRLEALTWMTPETKVKARAKLAAFTPKIGFPSKWHDYSALAIEADDLIGNAIRAANFEHDRQIAKLGKPIDRAEWFMTPMEVNAYANPTMNEIVFPAAILQPPFFDPNADDAVNYGGIGAVIGHEISHHFDDQGRKFDATGALTDWWTAEDVKRFDALTAQLVAQYDAYEPLPGLHIQGKLTLGENIADLAGLTIAHEAYLASLGGKKPPVLGGFTADQRFYLGWAQVWRRSYREANLRQRLLTDPHSPSIQRAWIVRNLDPWYAAFDPAPGASLYLPSDRRVRIW